MGSPAKGVCRLVLYLLWFGLMLPVQAVCVWLRLPGRRGVPRRFHRVSCRIFGLKLIEKGHPCQERPTLFVSNHSSYLDIEVLGAVLNASFVAKAEVAKWPLFGFLARIQETVFIDRAARREIDRQNQSLRDRLEAGDNLILFPEGTSSDGNRTLPFKTALFAVAERRLRDQALRVQPISVTAVAMDGIPIGRTLRPIYAWYGDMDLLPHLWSVVQAGEITVVVEFHEPATIEAFGTRKALAEYCRGRIAEGVSRAVAGRWLAADAQEGQPDDGDAEPHQALA